MSTPPKLNKEYQIREAMRTLLQSSTRPAERKELFADILASGEMAAPLLPVLFANLHNKPQDLQQLAFDLAMAIERDGHNVSPLAAELASHLSSSHLHLRQQAAQMLERMGPLAKPAEDYVLGCLRNKDRAVALNGLRILHAIGSALSRGIGARVSATAELFPGDEEIGEIVRQVRSLIDAPSGNLKELAQEARAHLNGRRILVADDDAAYRLMLAGALKAAGAEITEATTGQKTLELLGTGPEAAADLLLLDIRLPDINGLKVLTQLRRHFADLPVVAISGINNDEIIHAAGKLGVHHYVLKSTGLGVLLRIIVGVLEERHTWKP